MRRVTWTFLSQHAQIIDYDGKRLLLGIATVGLVNTFRAGNHAELVRQALIDEIGVDVPVEGVPMPDAGSDRRAAASTRGDQRPAPSRAPEPEPEPWPEPEADPWTQPGAPPEFVPTAEERSAAPPTSRPTVPPTDAPTTTPTTRGSSAGLTATSDDSGAPSTTRAAARRPRAAPAPRGTPAQARADGLPPNGATGRGGAAAGAVPDVRSGSPDDAVSDDDENIATTSSDGRAVVERVLGGQFLGELED